ncbi:MAG: A24 family peptidase [Pseudomonadota bacterium]
MSFVPYICLTTAILLLVILCIIDLRVRLLPNVLVFPFAVLGVAFHFSTDFQILPYQQMLIGGAVGYGFLFALRMAANAYYKQDSLGLGDVKLMGAAGLWLGAEGVLIALTVGAFAGLIHGIAYGLVKAATGKTKPDFHRLAIPAGPGFAIGIVISGLWIFHQTSYIVLPI